MNRILFSTLFVMSIASHVSSVYCMLSELESNIVSAAQMASHSALIKAFQAHEQALCSSAGTLLKEFAPNANVALGEIKTAAEMTSAIASIVPGGAGVAAVAGDIESIAGGIQQGMGVSSSTAGGSASTAAKNSPLVQAALDAEKAAQAGSGIGSRTIAGIICLFSLAGVGVKGYVDWYSTNSNSSEDQTQQRIAAYVDDIPTFAGLLAAAGTSAYYAITNKWQQDQITKAKVTTAAVTNHVNTITPITDALNQVKQKQAAQS